MILTTAILLILLGCWLNGRKRGVIAIVISTVTYFLGWLLARVGARPLGLFLSSILPSIGSQPATVDGSQLSSAITTSSNQFLYNGIAFMIIFYGVTWLSRWLLKRLRFLKKVPVVGTLNGWAGGILDVVCGYLIIFMFLMIFQMWPGNWWQDQLAQSGLAQWMITETPILTTEAIHWFS